MERFYLGTHKPVWLERTDVPLFISRRRLEDYANLPRAKGPWAIDSGGFTELSKYGRWVTPMRRYIEQVYRWQDEVGNLDWAACQDWMCEEEILIKTGKSILLHQLATLYNYLELMHRAPDLPWVPVLQGFHLSDYLRHRDMYEFHGVDLTKIPVLGIGSVCRRQGTLGATMLMMGLHDELPGIRLHGFGFKIDGLAAIAGLNPDVLYSSDSMAWSLNARNNPPLPQCPHKHCGNCMIWAMKWRQRLLDKVAAAEVV